MPCSSTDRTLVYPSLELAGRGLWRDLESPWEGVTRSIFNRNELYFTHTIIGLSTSNVDFEYPATRLGSSSVRQCHISSPQPHGTGQCRYIASFYRVALAEQTTEYPPPATSSSTSTWCSSDRVSPPAAGRHSADQQNETNWTITQELREVFSRTCLRYGLTDGHCFWAATPALTSTHLCWGMGGRHTNIVIIIWSLHYSIDRQTDTQCAIISFW